MIVSWLLFAAHVASPEVARPYEGSKAERSAAKEGFVPLRVVSGAFGYAVVEAKADEIYLAYVRNASKAAAHRLGPWERASVVTLRLGDIGPRPKRTSCSSPQRTRRTSRCTAFAGFPS
ncbi:MAG: hypothetical protein HC923_13610 [Myxococcales bacterium]|nr:hypothetical protein [Myxococcales bacterium]